MRLAQVARMIAHAEVRVPRLSQPVRSLRVNMRMRLRTGQHRGISQI
jgi:hypothetical protein